MSEIEAILSPAFLLKLVAIETIKQYSTIDTSIKNEGLQNKVELKVMLIEPSSDESELNENIYEIILKDVTSYQIDFLNPDDRTFEFDTDEVKLERESKSEGMYILSFINASVEIYIKFSGVEVKLLTGKK